MVGIERVVAPVRILRLRIHQEAELAAARARQHHVVRVVEGDPVAFPAAVERLLDRRYQRIALVLDPLAAFPGASPCRRRRIHCDPAVLLQVHLGTAVLRALQLARVATELAVAER